MEKQIKDMYCNKCKFKTLHRKIEQVQYSTLLRKENIFKCDICRLLEDKKNK